MLDNCGSLVSWVMTVCYRTSVQEETKHAAEEEEVQEEEEEEEVVAGGAEDVMINFQQFESVELSEFSGADKKQCTRRIIAEDPSWTLLIVPSLTDICIRHIADNFCC